MKEKIINGLKWFYRSYIWLGLVLLGLDIITKQIILSFKVTDGTVISDWGFVHIRYILNKGAAFGMGTSNEVANRIIYLVVATLITAGLMTFLIIKRKETKLFVRASLIMVVTGAVGNVIDRLFYGPLQGATEPFFSGKVVDWIDFWWFWPYVFNIADCCIVIAAFMLIIYVIVGEVKEALARRKAEVSDEKILSKSEQERLEREQKEKEENK